MIMGGIAGGGERWVDGGGGQSSGGRSETTTKAKQRGGARTTGCVRGCGVVVQLHDELRTDAARN